MAAAGASLPHKLPVCGHDNVRPQPAPLARRTLSTQKDSIRHRPSTSTPRALLAPPSARGISRLRRGWRGRLVLEGAKAGAGHGWAGREGPGVDGEVVGLGPDEGRRGGRALHAARAAAALHSRGDHGRRPDQGEPAGPGAHGGPGRLQPGMQGRPQARFEPGGATRVLDSARGPAGSADDVWRRPRGGVCGGMKGAQEGARQPRRRTGRRWARRRRRRPGPSGCRRGSAGPESRAGPPDRRGSWRRRGRRRGRSRPVSLRGPPPAAAARRPQLRRD